MNIRVFSAFIFFTFLFVENILAQPFAVGSSSVTWTDASRSNRSVPVEIYYPATTAGNNTPVAAGEFPVMVIGHGFSMGVNAYYNFRDFFVPKGFILILVDTETGLSPNHATFGADLNFAVNNMQSLNTNQSSIFFGKVKNKTALMGHSMGGGCSFIAAGTGNPNIATLLGFAPAETSTSAIAAASNISIPALMFYGNKDAVTPPQNHVIPMYNNLQSSCKAMVTIIDGAHCRFANSNTACNFGEGTSCIACTFVTNAVQQQRTYAIMEPWLNFYLKEDCTAWTAFESSLDNTTGTTYVRDCDYSLPSASISANGNTEFCFGGNVTLTATSSTGDYTWSNGETTQDITVSTSDNYSISVIDEYNCTATSNNIDVTVFQPEVANIISSSGSSLCGGSSTLSVDNSFQSYLWSTGETTAAINVTSADNYSVTVIDVNNCESISNIFSISNAPEPQIIFTGTPNFCDGEIVQLSVDGVFDTYLWSTGETANSIEVTASNTYSVTVDDGNGCTNTTSETITFNSLPAVPVINQKSDSLYISGNAVNIEWYYEGNLIASGTNIIKADNEGEYTVVITDGNGCSVESDVFEYFAVSVVENNLQTRIKVYPNPTQSFFNIISEKEFDFQLTDISGKVFLYDESYNNIKKVDISLLASGNYILSIRTENKVATYRIVKH